MHIQNSNAYVSRNDSHLKIHTHWEHQCNRMIFIVRKLANRVEVEDEQQKNNNKKEEYNCLKIEL